MEMLLIMVVFIGLMYVLMVLPQKRKMDAQRKLLDSLEPGARVMLNTGMFGTIRATGNQQMVVELAPGVEVTMLRQAVMRAATPEEEEFEYSDGSEQLAGADLVNDSFVADPQFTSDSEFSSDSQFAPNSEQVWDQPEQYLATNETSVAPDAPIAEPDSEPNFYGQDIPEDQTDRPQDR